MSILFQSTPIWYELLRMRIGTLSATWHLYGRFHCPVSEYWPGKLAFRGGFPCYLISCMFSVIIFKRLVIVVCGLSTEKWLFIRIYRVFSSDISFQEVNIRRDKYLLSLYWLISNVFHTVLWFKRCCVFTGPADSLATQGIGNFRVGVTILSAVPFSYNWLISLGCFVIDLIGFSYFLLIFLFYFLCICSFTTIISNISSQESLIYTQLFWVVFDFRPCAPHIV